MKKRVTLILFLIIMFSWNTHMAIAVFLEAGAQKFKTPVEAPHFKLKDLGGGQISLNEFRGKVIVLNFFTIW